VRHLPRSLLLGVLTSTAVFAQAEWSPYANGQPLPAPLPNAPVAQNAPAPVDPREPVKAGVQFHAAIEGGTTGFGPSASVGIGFNRVAILLTPALLISQASNLFSLGVGVRIYFKQRVQGALVGFIRPELIVGIAGSSSGSSAFFGGGGLAGGGEYLLTRNLGFTAELGVRYLSNLQALATTGSLGIMLHGG
jgi:hypothetical protein